LSHQPDDLRSIAKLGIDVQHLINGQFEAGDVVMVQPDFFDPIYTIRAAPLAFGARPVPMAVTVAGRKASAAIVEYRGGDKCPGTPPDLADRLLRLVS